MIDQLQAFLTQFAGTLGAFVTICGIIYAIWRKAAKPAVSRGYRRTKSLFETMEALGDVARAQLNPEEGSSALLEVVSAVPEIRLGQTQTVKAIHELTVLMDDNHTAAETHWKGLESQQNDMGRRQDDFRKETRAQFRIVRERLDKLDGGERSA